MTGTLVRLSTRRRGLVAPFAVALVAALTSVGARAQEAPEGEVIEDESMEFLMNGQKIGYVRTVVRRAGGIIIVTAQSVMELSRFGTTIRQEVRQEMRETAAGDPVSFRMVQKMAAFAVTIEGRFQGGRLHLTSKTMGGERTRVEEWPEGARFGWALEKYIRGNMARPEGAFTFTTYSPELDRFVTVTYENAGVAEVEVRGRTVRVTRWRIHGLYPGMIPDEYRDSSGTVWKLVINMLGLRIEAVRATREKAEAPPATPATVDLLLDLSVRIRSRIARQFEVDHARYRVSVAEGDARELSLDGPGQRVEKRNDDGSVILSVRAVRPDPARVLPRPIRDPAMKKYLEPSTFVQSDDPEIVAAAREVAGDGSSSYVAAKRLELWVMRNMKHRGFDRGFASAKEVFKDRAGDCTEHAVLLCAMMRAVGIPSRVATGIEYFELQPGRYAFFYHMWVEGYTGEWVPFDATLAGRFVDAAHIRLSSSALEGMSPAGGALELMQFMGRLRLTLLEYSIDGRRVTPVAGAPRGVVETRCRVPDYGVSFAVPEGWEVRSTGLAAEIAAAVERRAGKERIHFVVKAVPPGRVLSGAIETLGGRRRLSDRREARLGNMPAVRMTITSLLGPKRELIVALSEGTLYILRLGPVTEAGKQALESVAESFRFE